MTRELFDQAMAQPAAVREAWLAKASGDNAELLARVKRLLAAREKNPSFLATAEPEGSPSQTRGAAAPAGHAGQIIDRYKLLQLIGEGGFGEVWMAEQERPVRRRVALKIIKAGMDTRQVVARFEAERQALAIMDHPNIARVFDAGATDTGRPYFVMELVRGVPITQFCDDAKLTTRQRVELLVPVCQAVQHAHQKGIIHRDIKPTNVLVTLHDGTPVPKVIDFGIAKATHQSLTDKTLYTEFRQMIGTPAYMSPEQAEMSGLDIDTRSDIYSLGVLMYELLTGTTPFDTARLVHAGMMEIQRIIREEDPPRPSLRLSTMGERLTTVANQRATEPGRIGKLVAGELDWIVMRAMEKDRRRRYETANDLAADLGRHISGEPIVAAPPSVNYRLRKLMRRYRRPIFAGLLLLSVLCFGLGGTLWQWQRARLRAAELERVAKIAENTLRHIYEQPNSMAKGNWIGPDGTSLVGEKDAERGQPHFAPTWKNGTPMTQREARMLLLSEVTYSNFEGMKEAKDAAEVEAYIANLALAQAAMQSDRWPEARQRLEACPESKRGWEWRYLRESANAVVAHLPIDAYSVVFSSDGSHVLAKTDKESICFDSQGRIVGRAPNLSGYGVAKFSPDGKSFIASPNSNVIQIFGLNGEAISAPMQYPGDIYRVEFSPDGSLLLTSGSASITRVWTRAGTPFGKPIPGGDGQFSPDGQLILTSGCGLITAGDFADSARLWTISGEPASATFVSKGGIDATIFSPDGKSVISKLDWEHGARFDLKGQRLGTTFRWGGGLDERCISQEGWIISNGWSNTKDGAKCLQVLGELGNAIGPEITLEDRESWAAAFLDGDHAIAVGVGYRLHIIDLENKSESRQVILPGPICDVRSGPDGTIFTTSGGEITRLQVWNRAGELLGEYTTNQANAGGLEVSTTGLVITRSQSWGSGSASPTIVDPKHFGFRRKYCPKDERELLAAAACDTSKDGVSMTTAIESHIERNGKIKVSYAGHELASFLAMADGWRVFKDNHQIAWLPSGFGTNPNVSNVFMPDGSRAVFVSNDRTLHFYDTKSWKELAVMPVSATAKDVQITPDGTRLLIDFDDDTMEIWDIRDYSARKNENDVRASVIPWAREHVQKLLASDKPTDGLRNSVLNNASISTLQKLVVLEQLKPELSQIESAAERQFKQLLATYLFRADIVGAVREQKDHRLRKALLTKIDAWTAKKEWNHCIMAAVIVFSADDSQERYARALQAATYLSDREPNNPSWRVNVGLALYRLRRNEEAVKVLQDALTLPPDDRSLKSTWAGLALAFHALGKHEQAKAALVKAFSLEAGMGGGLSLCMEAAALIDPASTQPTTAPAGK